METSLLLAVTSNDIARCEALATKLGGTVYADDRDDHDKLPFRALLTCVSDDLQPLEAAAEGIYLVAQRIVKPGSANVFGLFPLVHHPEKSRRVCDAHWRDVHGPLALQHHAHMTHYLQLSVVHKISGRTLNGFALCGFATVEDLRDRFYTEPASETVIAQDIAKFADLKRSPRGLIATPSTF